MYGKYINWKLQIHRSLNLNAIVSLARGGREERHGRDNMREYLMSKIINDADFLISESSFDFLI